MSDCRKCAEVEWCAENEDCALFKPKQQTNADRIRAMSDEELARFLGEIQWDVANYCGGVITRQLYPYPESTDDNEWIPWLKSPVEVDNGA